LKYSLYSLHHHLLLINAMYLLNVVIWTLICKDVANRFSKCWKMAKTRTRSGRTCTADRHSASMTREFRNICEEAKFHGHIIFQDYLVRSESLNVWVSKPTKARIDWYPVWRPKCINVRVTQPFEVGLLRLQRVRSCQVRLYANTGRQFAKMLRVTVRSIENQQKPERAQREYVQQIVISRRWHKVRKHMRGDGVARAHRLPETSSWDRRPLG